MDTRGFLLLLALGLLVTLSAAAPRDRSKSSTNIPGASENEIEENVNDIKEDDKVDQQLDDLGLEYGQYLQEVVKTLDQDPEFSKKLENITHEQIMSGHVARHIESVAPDVRNKLDELKRIELERLRKLALREHQLEAEMEAESQQNGGAEDDKNSPHINHHNPHTFEAEDLQRLILQATKDLDELDRKRRRDFKQYEMEKELQYRDGLQNMTAEQRAEAERKHQELKNKHNEHAKVHHPGSKQQLEQVWEEQDNMPKQEFDPKLFFQMHDLNGDGFLDQEEVEAILTIEVKKLYNEKDPNYDRNEMIEEYHRMREHIYKEIDANHDGLISRKEFIDYTKQAEFQKDDGWKGIEEAPVYTEEELRRYQQERQALHDHYAKYGAYQMPYQPGMEYVYQPVYYQVPGQQQGYHPQQQGYHPEQQGYHPQQQQGYHPQAQGYHPQGQQVQYVVNAPPQHVQQPVQYQHVQLPPQHVQTQYHPAQGQPQYHGGPPPQHPGANMAHPGQQPQIAAHPSSPNQQQGYAVPGAPINQGSANQPPPAQPNAGYQQAPPSGQYQANQAGQHPPPQQQQQQHPSQQQQQQQYQAQAPPGPVPTPAHPK